MARPNNTGASHGFEDKLWSDADKLRGNMEAAEYALSLVSGKALVDYTDSHSAGTKMPRTNWKDMGRYPLALPPKSLVKAFQDHIAAFHQRISLGVRQNRRLAGLRDTLLPKLLSGEIELPEAEGIAEEVDT